MSGNAARVSAYGTAIKERKANEFYSTPYFCTESLIKELGIPKDKSILEPACGQLAIVDIFKKHGYKNLEYYDKMFFTGRSGEQKDFYSETGRFDYVITNPPFSETTEFLLKAFEVATERVIFLLPLDYLHGKERHSLFYARGWLEKVFMFTRRIMFGLEDPAELQTNGMITMAWFIFSKQENNTELKFISCDPVDEKQEVLFT